MTGDISCLYNTFVLRMPDDRHGQCASLSIHAPCFVVNGAEAQTCCTRLQAAESGGGSMRVCAVRCCPRPTDCCGQRLSAHCYRHPRRQDLSVGLTSLQCSGWCRHATELRARRTRFFSVRGSSGPPAHGSRRHNAEACPRLRRRALHLL